jgi:quercetin dioxygenase-like cupin family protein
VAGYTVRHLDDLERSGRWILARKSLGVGSFGMNVVEIAPGKDIPEHDETGRDQEEVFLVLDGELVFVVDGDRHPAPRGTFLRCDPEATRTAVNESDEPARLLIVSAPRSSGYEPMEWA